MNAFLLLWFSIDFNQNRFKVWKSVSVECLTHHRRISINIFYTHTFSEQHQRYTQPSPKYVSALNKMLFHFYIPTNEQRPFTIILSSLQTCCAPYQFYFIRLYWYLKWYLMRSAREPNTYLIYSLIHKFYWCSIYLITTKLLPNSICQVQIKSNFDLVWLVLALWVKT